MNQWNSVEDMKGGVIGFVKVDKGDETIIFTMTDGREVMLYHAQDCCESVWIEDIVGSWDDIIGSPLLIAEESTNTIDSLNESGRYDHTTWTYYRFGTFNGSVSVRWCGTSNGYYSESVNFAQIMDPTEETPMANNTAWYMHYEYELKSARINEIHDLLARSISQQLARDDIYRVNVAMFGTTGVTDYTNERLVNTLKKHDLILRCLEEGLITIKTH